MDTQKSNSKSLNESPFWQRVILFLIASIVPGILIGFAWRTPGLGLLGIPGLAIFLYVQSSLNRFRSVSLSAMITGTTAYLIACCWFGYTIEYLIHIDEFWANLLILPVCMLQGGHYVLFAIVWLLARRISKYGFWLAPFLWCAVQGNWPGLFPCRNGCLLLETPSLCQIAEIGGVDLVSLFAGSLSLALTVLFLILRSRTPETPSIQNVLTPKLFRQHGVLFLVAMSFVTVLVFLWGQHRTNELASQMRVIKGNPLRLLIVQANTEYKESNARMIEVSRQFEGEVDLVVWPESSLGSYNRELNDYADAKTVAEHATGKDMTFQPFPNPVAPLLAGASTWHAKKNGEAPKTHFVSAMLFDKDEQLVGRHDKVELMPYGESIPGEWMFPFFRQWFGSDQRVLVGEKTSPIGTAAGMNLGVVLCCEDMHPKLVRRLVASGSDLIVTLGNGIAFDSEIALQQHFRIAQMRAIEHRRYFLRCTSHGVSGLIDPTGELIIELPTMVDGAASIAIPRVRLPSTTYSSNGAFIEFTLIGFPLIVLVVPMLRRLSRKRNPGASVGDQRSSKTPSHAELARE